MERSGRLMRSVSFEEPGWPGISMSAPHLLPVSGTPHANAARVTPGTATTRSSASLWNSVDFWRSIVVTVAARMFSVS